MFDLASSLAAENASSRSRWQTVPLTCARDALNPAKVRPSVAERTTKKIGGAEDYCYFGITV